MPTSSYTRTESITGTNTWIELNEHEHQLSVENESIKIDTIVDAKHVEWLKKYTWSVRRRVHTKNPNAEVSSYFRAYPGLLHQCIMLCEHGKEVYEAKKKEKLTIDHINRDTTDNRLTNLRWATYSEQQKNKKKQARHYNAPPLPVAIADAQLPIWATYRKQQKRPGGPWYEGFEIRDHPKLSENRWWTPSTDEFTILEKLDMLYYKLKELDPIAYAYLESSGKSKEQYIFERDDKIVVAEQSGFVLKKSMLPKNVCFIIPELGVPHGYFLFSNKGEEQRFTSSKKFSLEEKYNKMLVHVQ